MANGLKTKVTTNVVLDYAAWHHYLYRADGRQAVTMRWDSGVCDVCEQVVQSSCNLFGLKLKASHQIQDLILSAGAGVLATNASRNAGNVKNCVFALNICIVRPVEAIQRDGLALAAVVLNRGLGDQAPASNLADLRMLVDAPVTVLDAIDPHDPQRLADAGALLWRAVREPVLQRGTVGAATENER